MAIYTTIRRVVEQSWVNNKDQYLLPDDSWKDDKLFQSDCLTYCLFQNTIESKEDTYNNFIPYTEDEVKAQEQFKSHFMSDFFKGVIRKEYLATNNADLFDGNTAEMTDIHQEPVSFSPAAQAVLDAGRKLWCYYHQQPQANADASFYDIRLYFQGTEENKKGKFVMKAGSKDPIYTKLLNDLRQEIKALTLQIAPKIYNYGFLKRNYEPLNKQPLSSNKRQKAIPPVDEEAEVPLNADGSKLQGFSIEEDTSAGNHVINVNIHNHFEGEIDNLTING